MIKRRMVRYIGTKNIRMYHLLVCRAAHAVGIAIKNGTLPPVRLNGKSTGMLCADCGKPAISYDHRDYFEPLKVEPVCTRCNVRRGPSIITLRKMNIDESILAKLIY